MPAPARSAVRVDYWEGARSVGRFEGDFFDPGEWRPEYPNPAFDNMRADDAFWAARLVARVPDEAIRAIVAKARYSEPGAADHIVDTLIARRDKVLRAWLTGVNPLADRTLSDGMSASAPLKGVFAPGETVGGARMQAAGALATYAIGRITDNQTAARIGADLIRAQIVTQMVTGAVKTAVGRTRPDGTQYSFPSGHSSTTFASATVLQRTLGWKVGIPAYAVAGYVAASRIQVRRHFLSDVAFGAALGIAAGRTVTIGRGDRRLTLAPAVVPGGGGVTVSIGN